MCPGTLVLGVEVHTYYLYSVRMATYMNLAPKLLPLGDRHSRSIHAPLLACGPPRIIGYRVGKACSGFEQMQAASYRSRVTKKWRLLGIAANCPVFVSMNLDGRIKKQIVHSGLLDARNTTFPGNQIFDPGGDQEAALLRRVLSKSAPAKFSDFCS